MRPQDRANVEAERAERTRKAVELRKKDFTYREIAKALDVDVSTAYDDVWRHYDHLQAIATEKLEKIRAKELRDLAVWEASIADQCEAGEPKAVLAGLKIKERRAKLLGLDAPTKHEHKDTTLPRDLDDLRVMRDRAAEALEELDRTIAEQVSAGEQRH